MRCETSRSGDERLEDAYMPISRSKRKRNVTVLAALAGMSLIFTSAAGIYWGIGSLFPSDDLDGEATSRETTDQHSAADPPTRQPLRRPPPNKIEPAEDARTEPKPPSTVQDPSTPTAPPTPAETMTDSQIEISRSTPSNSNTRVSNQPATTSFRSEASRPTIDINTVDSEPIANPSTPTSPNNSVEPLEAPYSPIGMTIRHGPNRVGSPSDGPALEEPSRA